MKYLFLLCVLLFINTRSSAQQYNEKALKDSVKHLLNYRQANSCLVLIDKILESQEAQASWADTSIIFLKLKRTAALSLLKKVDLAIKENQAILDAIQQEFGQQHITYVKALVNLGNLYIDQTKDKKALDTYTQAQNIYTSFSQAQDKTYTEILTNIGIAHYYLTKYDKAIPIFEEVLKIQEQTLGQNHIQSAETFYLMGRCYFSMSEFVKSVTALQKAITIQEQEPIKDYTSYGEKHNTIALSYQELNKKDLALKHFKQALEIYEDKVGEDHPNYSILLCNYGLFQKRRGEREEALKLYERAKKNLEQTKGKALPAYASIIRKMIYLKKEEFKYYESLTLLEEIKTIQEQTVGKNHISYAYTIKLEGNLNQLLKRDDKALDLLSKAKDIFANTAGTETPVYAHILTNIGLSYINKKEYQKAFETFQKAGTIFLKKFSRINRHYASTIYHLATVRNRQRRYKEADKLYQELLNISGQLYAPKHQKNLSYLTQTAKNQLLAGLNEKADSTLIHTLYLITNTHLGIQINSDWKKAVLQQKLNSLNLHKLVEIVKAIDIKYSLAPNQATVKTNRQLLHETILSLFDKIQRKKITEKDKLRILQKKAFWLKKYIALLHTSEGAIAFEYADRNKSVLLLRSLQHDKLYNLPTSIQEKRKDLIRQNEKLLAKLATQKDVNQRKHTLRKINDSYRTLQKFTDSIETAFPKFAQLSNTSIEFQFKEIQENLEEHTALIEYIIMDTTLHIFCVQKDKLNWHKVELPSTLLNTNIQKFHDFLSNVKAIEKEPQRNFEAYTKLAHWFYKTLLEPALVNQSGIKKLIIIPDKTLAHLPFETFLSSPVKSNKARYDYLPYLLRDYRISYNYSAMLWKENMQHKSSQNNGQILGIAADYQLNSDKTTTEWRSYSDEYNRSLLSPLPAAQREVANLQNLYKGTFLFNEQASEQNVKKQAPQFAVLHLAVHGLLNTQHPSLSSLALTENNDSLHNNFWQAHEIANSQLNAELAILSACETGLGTFEEGNGVASLARAFMYANVPALVVSLWQVNDQSTALLMQHFYKHLHSGLTKDEALRQAKLDYIQKTEGLFQHPSLWAAFIQMGNTKAIKLQRQSPINWILVLGGSVVLGIIIVLFRLRKR